MPATIHVPASVKPFGPRRKILDRDRGYELHGMLLYLECGHIIRTPRKDRLFSQQTFRCPACQDNSLTNPWGD